MAPGSVDGLFDVLLKAFNQYVATHAPMTPEDKLLATQQLNDVVYAINSDED
jgi:hypothetical protein